MRLKTAALSVLLTGAMTTSNPAEATNVSEEACKVLRDPNLTDPCLYPLTQVCTDRKIAAQAAIAKCNDTELTRTVKSQFASLRAALPETQRLQTPQTPHLRGWGGVNLNVTVGVPNPPAADACDNLNVYGESSDQEIQASIPGWLAACNDPNLVKKTCQAQGWTTGPCSTQH